MQDLLPGRTVVVAAGESEPTAGHWTVDHPFLIFDERRERPRKLARVAGRLTGRGSAQAGKRFLKRYGVEVVLGEYLDYSLRWLEPCRELGVKFYAHAHGYDVSQHLLRPEWRQAYLRYGGADGVITMSAVSRQRLVDLGLEPAKVHSIPYGVDVPREAPVLRGPVHDDLVRCLAVGRFVAKKAPILTLEAFKRAVKDVPALRLDYIGDGDLWPAAREFVRASGLENSVTLHGAQPSSTVARLLGDADLFVQHSIVDPDSGDEEGLPVAILEAMAQSVPVVSTRHAGIPEAVADGVTGFLVEERDVAAMTERIVELARDGALRRSMGQAGWKAAKDSFSWERERADLLALLDLD